MEIYKHPIAERLTNFSLDTKSLCEVLECFPLPGCEPLYRVPGIVGAKISTPKQVSGSHCRWNQERNSLLGGLLLKLASCDSHLPSLEVQ